MELPVAAMATRRRPRRGRRLRRPPRISPPRNVERDLLGAIVAMTEVAHELVQSRVVPSLDGLVRRARGRTDEERNDDYVDELGRTFEGLRVVFAERVPDRSVERASSEAARAANGHNAKQVNQQVKAVLGIDVFSAEPWLAPALNGWVRQNVSAIKSVPERYLGEVEQLVLQGLLSGRRASAIAEEIEHRFEVSKSRAAFIAVDQLGSLNGQLTRRRHTDLGLKRYRWRTSMDERVRGRPDGKYPRARHNHWRREGKIYTYDSPPSDGHPGEPPRCRCWSEPVFEDLVDDLAVDQTPAPAASRAVALGSDRFARRASGRKTVIRQGMTLSEAEEAIRPRVFEHIGAFDADGNLLYTGVGKRNEVPLPPPLIAQMRQRGDVLLTHNHPRSSPLSPADIVAAIFNNAREIRAVRKRGGVWRLERPSDGWRMKMDQVQFAQEVGAVWNLAYNIAVFRSREEVRGKKTRRAIDRAIENAISEEVSRAINAWAESRGFKWRLELEE